MAVLLDVTVTVPDTLETAIFVVLPTVTVAELGLTLRANASVNANNVIRHKKTRSNETFTLM